MNLLTGKEKISNQDLFSNNFYIRFLQKLTISPKTIYNFIEYISFDFCICLLICVLYIIVSLIDYFVLARVKITPTNDVYITLAKNSINNIYDFGFLTSILAALLVSNAFMLLYWIPIKYNSFLIWNFILLAFITIVLPCYILKNYGIYYLGHLRGAGLSNVLIKEIFDDFIAVLSFFLRINIQLIRILIATIFFAIIVDYWEHTGAISHQMLISGELIFVLDYFSFASSYIWFVLFRVLYEIGHFWLLFFIQSTAFSMILIMLVQFLYICFLIDKIELYFIKKIKE